jgi:CHAT domain-containing protein/tetratricopeptide (TPR) repeat protein
VTCVDAREVMWQLPGLEAAEAEARFPQVLAHLRTCASCHERFAAIALTAEENAAGVYGPPVLDASAFDTLDTFARLSDALGDHDRAESLYRRGLDTRETALGHDHPETLRAANNLGIHLSRKGDLLHAEPLLRHALAARERLLGPEHHETLSSANNLAVLYDRQGRAHDAETLFRRVFELRQRALGEEHPDTLSARNNLALALASQGRYARAADLLSGMLASLERARGRDHPHTLAVCSNLAFLHVDQGRADLAEPLYRRAFDGYTRVFGPEHRETLDAANNRGVFYARHGRFAEAEPLLAQTLATRERVLGPLHADTLGTVGNLALCLAYQQRYDEAEPLHRRAVDGFRQLLGDGHPQTLGALNNLALLHMRNGNYGAAEPLYQSALSGYRRVRGDDHPDTINVLANLAYLYECQGRDDLAQAHYRHALDLRLVVLGDAHPATLESMQALSVFLGRHARWSEAMALASRAREAETLLMSRALGVATPREQAIVLQQAIAGLRVSLSLLLFTQQPPTPETIRVAYDLVLKRKAIGLLAEGLHWSTIVAREDQTLRAMFRDWQELGERILTMSLAGPAPAQTVAQLNAAVRDLERAREDVYVRLLRALPHLTLGTTLSAADCAAVAERLGREPERPTLVEFLRVEPIDFGSRPGHDQREWLPPVYVAFVLRASADRFDVEAITIDDAETIDAAIQEARRWSSDDDNVDEAESRGDGSLGAMPACLRTLRRRLVEPLALDSTEALIIAPDGDLSLFPFELLPAGATSAASSEDGRRDTWLGDRRVVSYLSSGRDLLRRGSSDDLPADGPSIVIGDPAFRLSAAEDVEPSVDSRSMGDALRRASITFPPLPATQCEARRIAARLQVRPWLQAEAYERSLKAAERPYSIHLATHGFVLTPADLALDDDQALAYGLPSRIAGVLDDPLRQAGLALAGAQDYLDGLALPDAAEDGLLLGTDVARLDLRGTALVVLSACETGLGRVHAGEGIFGLRRAFAIAGAQSLIMSLWKVDDLATAILMDAFYEELFDLGVSRVAALRRARERLRFQATAAWIREWYAHARLVAEAGTDADLERDVTALAVGDPSRLPFQSPSYWAAFILAGDRGPLPGRQPPRPA